MFRRRFLQLMTLAGAGSLAPAAKAAQTKNVTYHIKGFSCITCAVGLDVMLRRNKGILRSNSTYPEAITRIDFEPTIISTETIKSLIAEMGFTAEEKF
jgi:anaerobic selenocysteine-containing dehydrogenase